MVIEHYNLSKLLTFGFLKNQPTNQPTNDPTNQPINQTNPDLFSSISNNIFNMNAPVLRN